MKTLINVIAASSTALLATPAIAEQAIGLVGDRTLVMFDSSNGKVTKTMDVTGVDRLLGIDRRPANDTLVGVTAENAIVTIDLDSGAATELSKMATPLEIGDAPVIVDFNPAADRLRYMTGTTNHRVNVETGEVTIDGSLAFEESDMHKGEVPNIVAAAYSNSYGKPEKTAMYDVDATIGALIRQTKPNDGTLAAIGKFGIEGAATNYAFDIHTSADGTNTAWLVNGTKLHTVDLETGQATQAGEITGVDGEIRDITFLQAM